MASSAAAPGVGELVSRAVPSSVVRRIPVVAAIITVVLGVIGAAGYASGSHALIQINPSLSGMKVNAIFCLWALGAALWLRATGRGRHLATLLSGSVLVLALAILFEWASNVSLGIDQLLVVDPLHAGTAGRPSPYTAAILSLLAGGMLTLDLSDPRPHVALIASAFATTLLAGMAFVYGANAVRGFQSTTGMAVATLVALFLLCVGQIALRGDRPPTSNLASPGASGQLTRRLLPAALLTPVILGSVRLLGQEAKLYDTRYGLALFTWAMTLVFSFLVIRTAQTVGGARKLGGSPRQTPPGHTPTSTGSSTSRMTLWLSPTTRGTLSRSTRRLSTRSATSGPAQEATVHRLRAS